MDKNFASQVTNWREYRRFQAWELYQKGWKQKDIAEALSVTKGSISQWVKRAKEGGVESLRHRKPPGAIPRLSPEQKAQLPGLLAQSAEAFGFRGDIWTQPRVTELIRRQFRVSYHPSQVGRILKECGWSRQKPARRAAQRDEEAIRRWKEERWPQVKKSYRGAADPGVAHLRLGGPDPGGQGVPEPRPSFGDERHHARGQTLHDGARKLL